MTLWWDIELTLDGDELRRYAVEAGSEYEAVKIALAAIPDPHVSASRLYVEPDEADIDYDQVLYAEES